MNPFLIYKPKPLIHFYTYLSITIPLDCSFVSLLAGRTGTSCSITGGGGCLALSDRPTPHSAPPTLTLSFPFPDKYPEDLLRDSGTCSLDSGFSSC